jgi:hypothetical protein
MDQAAVQAAIARVEAAGKVASLSAIRRELGGGSWRDITKWRRAIMGNGDREEADVSMALEGMVSLSDPLPPRRGQEVAPVAEEEKEDPVTAAQAALTVAEAAEQAFLVQRMALKAQLKACEQAGKALDWQRPPLPRAERERQQATLREQGEALQAQWQALNEPHDAAIRRIILAREAVKRVRHAQRRAQGRRPQEG